MPNMLRKLVHHRPDLGFRQLGMGDGDIDITMLPILPVLKLKQRVGHSNINWETWDLYEPYIDRWRSRWHQCFLEEAEEREDDAQDDHQNRDVGGPQFVPVLLESALPCTPRSTSEEEEYLFDETDCDIGAVSDFISLCEGVVIVVISLINCKNLIHLALVDYSDYMWRKRAAVASNS
ncbi:hypothetical protein Q3G72_019648 [Acer saccharum]|nr:hypothetical protein Q3G72_019648 [Acer saccharum]